MRVSVGRGKQTFGLKIFRKQLQLWTVYFVGRARLIKTCSRFQLVNS